MKNAISNTVQTKKPALRKPLVHNDNDYELFLKQIKNRFSKIIKHTQFLFTTNSPYDLFDVFIKNLPLNMRQHYTCNACKHFVNRFGGIVSINDDGNIIPVMWDIENVPPLYKKSVNAIYDMIFNHSTVTGVFVSSEYIWGNPVTGEWHHMAVIPPKGIVFNKPTMSDHQYTAEKSEDYKTLINGLAEFPLTAIETAITLLKTDSLYRSEKILGVAEWIRNIHKKRSSTRNNFLKSNITWLAVASAPAGFCHIKSSMIGTLLEDITNGLSFIEVKKRFEEKMHPLQYQRPQAAPTPGNIYAAEKIIEQFKAAGSLERRFARLDEIPTIWEPLTLKKKRIIKTGTGVFSHLEPKYTVSKSPKKTIIPTMITMTWEKFYKTVLPTANKIEFLVPTSNANFAALVTAKNPKSPPIIQWDLEDNRNPVSWYIYHGGSEARQWELEEGKYCDVTGICFQPSMWNSDKFKHQGESVIFILHGAKDAFNQNLGLFPEILKSDFHSIRSTIESFSRHGSLDGFNKASACGIRLQNGVPFVDMIFKVTTKDSIIEYNLDRWD